MPADVIAQAILQGLQMGAIYALIALSMTLIFSVSGLLNFAHGDLLALAMYGTFVLHRALGIDSYLAAPLIFAIFLLIGFVLFRSLIEPVLLKGGELAGVQLTLGVVFVIQSLLLMTFGGDYHSVPTILSNRNLVMGPLTMQWSLLVGSGVAVVLAALLFIVLMRTDFGRQVRAIMQNSDAAALMGIRINRVRLVAFGVGVGLLGLTGPVVIAQFTLTPVMGLDFTLIALIIMVVGGLGSFLGSMLAGLIIGISGSVGSLYFGGVIGAMIPYAVLLLVLLFRPNGLMGEQ